VRLFHVRHKKPVGAELARQGDLTFKMDVDWQAAFASKLCSYK
jgi:hypothetical protein